MHKLLRLSALAISLTLCAFMRSDAEIIACMPLEDLPLEDPIAYATLEVEEARVGALASITPDSPLGLWNALITAYEARDADTYAGLLTSDFVFHFADDDLQARYPQGWAKADETASARRLFTGGENSQGIRVSAADSVDVEYESAHGVAPSTQEPRRRQISVLGLVFTFHFGSEVVRTSPQELHVRVARGDLAALDSTQTATLDRWYVEEMREFPPGTEAAAVANRRAEAGGGEVDRAPATTQRELRFGIDWVGSDRARRVTNVAFVLTSFEPAIVEVFDVRGRRLLRQEIEAPSPGVRQVQLAPSRGLATGVYFVRLRQGAQTAVEKAVFAGSAR